MKNKLRITAWPLALVALLLLSPTRAVGSPPTTDEGPKADCAFSNPGYSGWCRVTINMPAGATPLQACTYVEGCLNGNACPYNYCSGANDIRSGWRLEEAKPSKPPTPSR